jgi:hypothetical protein
MGLSLLVQVPLSIPSRQRPVADVEVAARSIAVVILGNLAYWHLGLILRPNWSGDENEGNKKNRNAHYGHSLHSRLPE